MGQPGVPLEQQFRLKYRSWTIYVAVAASTAVIAGTAVMWHFRNSGPDAQFSGHGIRPPKNLSEADVRQLCSHCHRFPDPESLPRASWRKTVSDMAALPGYGVNVKFRVSPADLANWFEQRAPEALAYPRIQTDIEPGSLALSIQEWTHSDKAPEPVVSHVKFVDLLDDPVLELLVCEMRNGGIWLGRAGGQPRTLERIAEVPNPAHAEVVDLNHDGRRDVVVANLGSFLPLDHNLGSVDWLRQTENGKFVHEILAAGLGRVADVQPADLDADGDLDLIVGEFGWRATGHLVVLENTASNPNRPEFIRRPVDGRSGTIHAQAADLDGDGRTDIVALLAQEHELVGAFLNQGNWSFEIRELYRAPYPSWGSSGMQLIDFDRDGDLDVLMTNGDTLDDGRIKPYHGITWLENLDESAFTPHHLAVVYGAHRAEAADLDGDGDLDIAACAFTNGESWYGNPASKDMPDLVGLLWLEQVAPGRFERHNLTRGRARYPTLNIADYDLDGDQDIVVGVATPPGVPVTRLIEVWENLGSRGDF